MNHFFGRGIVRLTRKIIDIIIHPKNDITLKRGSELMILWQHCIVNIFLENAKEIEKGQSN
jgi:hypothetical protein